jgi:hypothetical protein
VASIDVTKQLNDLLEEQNKLYEEQTDMLKTQLNTMQKMLETIRQMDLETTGRNMEQLNSAVAGAGKAAQELSTGQQTMASLSNTMKDATESSDELGDSIETFAKKALKASSAIAAFEGFASGLRFSANVMTDLVGTTTSLVGSFVNLSAAIISTPFKVLYGLMGMVGAGSSELRREFEKVRVAFGDLAKNESKAVVDGFRHIDHFGGRLAETGLRIRRVMGNMAQQLAALREIAEQMGPLFHNFSQELADGLGAQRIFAYQKGLHLTEEGLRAVTEQASRAGTTIQETGRDITSVAFSMGEAFGINGSLISRDIGNMIDDFEHFGNLSTRQLSQVSVFARRLGVEIEKLTGALDAFSDFDKAAENVSQLSQAFGIQLDTLALVQEQDPAANIERMRKAFFAAGRSIETMTRQERALLAQTTGLDEKTASLVFSQENQAVSYEQIQKQGANAEKQQLSQAEAMEKLANSIERLIQDGSALQGGFFDIFLQGFLKGIRFSKEFFGVMRNLRMSMRATLMAGREVGRMFVREFPGVSDVLKSISELFDPVRFRKMLNGVKTAFRDFFRDMTTNPQVALPRLLDRLKKGFTDWFSTSTPAGRKMLEGIRSFAKAAVHIFAGLLREALKGVREIFDGIKTFIKGGMSGATREATTGVAGFLLDIFEPLITFAKSSEFRTLISSLADSFMSMLSAAWEIVGPMIGRFLSDHWPVILAVLFGPAIISGLAKGLSTALLSAITGGVGGALSKGAGVISNAVGTLGAAASGADVASGATAAKGSEQGVASMSNIINDTRGLKLSVSDIARLALLGSVIILGLGAVARGMIYLAGVIQEQKISLSSIAAVSALMLATGAVMLEIAGIIRLLAPVGEQIKAQSSGLAIGLAAVAVVGLAMAAAARGMIWAFSDVPMSEINKTSIILAAAGEFFLIAAGITAVAGAVGVAMLASLGGGVAAILTGLATIGVVIIAMVATIKQVVHEFSNIRIDSSTQQRMEVFTTILEAIGSFAGSVATIVEATAPSFADMLGGGEPMTKRLASVAALVTNLGNAMTTVVQNLVIQAQKLGGDAAGEGSPALKNAQALAEILGTFGTVAEQLQPPEEFTDVGFWDSLMGDTVSSRLEQLTSYVQTIINSMSGTITTLAREFSTIANTGAFTDETVNAAKAIGEIIGAVGTLGRVMTVFISREYATTDPEVLRRMAPQLGAVISSILGAIIGSDGTNIFTRMTDVLQTVVDSVKGLSRSQLNAVKTASPIIEAVFTTISSIAGLLGNMGIGEIVSGTPEETRQQMSSLTGIVEAITTGLGGSITELINSLKTSFSGLTGAQSKSIQTGGDAVKQIFDAVGPIVENISNFIKDAANEDVTNLGLNLSNGLVAIRNLIYNPGGHFTLNDFVASMVPAFTTIGSQSSGLQSSVSGFVGSIEAIKTGLTAVNTFFTTDAITQLSQLDENALSPVKAGVEAFNTRLTDIDQALKNVKGFDVTTRLQELNGRLGLRSTGRLDIREEPIQFNVNFTVQIDAEELEEVLIDRPNSRFARTGG